MHRHIYKFKLVGLSLFLLFFAVLQLPTTFGSKQGKSVQINDFKRIEIEAQNSFQATARKIENSIRKPAEIEKENSQSFSGRNVMHDLNANTDSLRTPSQVPISSNSKFRVIGDHQSAGRSKFDSVHVFEKSDDEYKIENTEQSSENVGLLTELDSNIEQQNAEKIQLEGNGVNTENTERSEHEANTKILYKYNAYTNTHYATQPKSEMKRKALYKNLDLINVNSGENRKTRFARSADSLSDSDYDYDFGSRDNAFFQEREIYPEETIGMENCTDCTQIREMKRSYRMNMIKAEILRKLRLSAAPNISGQVRPSIPHIERLIAQLNEEANQELFASNLNTHDDDRATPMSVILFAQSAPPEVSVSDSTICWFPLHQDALRHTIVNATLGVYIRNSTTGTSSSRGFDTYLLVHRLGPKTPGGDAPPRRRVQFRRIKLGGLGGMEGRWVEIDMKAALSRLVGKREMMYGLQIEAWDESGRQVAVVMPQRPSENLYRPYLEIHVTERPMSRPRRTPERLCEELEAERTCCRYPLQVDFREFGWDFVIVPRVYSAYYCSGECPYLFMQTNTNTGLTHAARRDGGGPCCTPRKMSPISMIYYDERMNIVYSKLPGMVVDSCGCS